MLLHSGKIFRKTNRCLKKINNLNPLDGHVRNVHRWTARETRQSFLDYFIKEHDHKFIRSSPVVPFCDPTVAFVNAGMNQFKGIFLNKQQPTTTKAANSQKCVRVGGKHNDLSVVGTDGYHHTFFEMLGNWSFGDYFKKEACELVWNLLTGPYRIPPSSLYITYFSGEPELNLGPDLECVDIWRNLGVSADHIIPCGLKDNFWEMGTTGPCGPCTEIHIDHTFSSTNRSQHVNKDFPDLTELWNIVFIEHNRNEEGKIEVLPRKHIDTGMGFERLNAVLQGKSSNYDTDIFMKLFDCIKKTCPGIPEYKGNFGVADNNGLDTAYRILTDHIRTVTVCLADGMIPEQNQKLRKILRKSLHLSESVFKKDHNLLIELSRSIADDLGETYPEIVKYLKQVQEIITFEQEIYKSIRSTASKQWNKITTEQPNLKNLNIFGMPRVVTAYNELKSLKDKQIPSALAFKLYDTHGLDVETIKLLCEGLKLSFDEINLKNELDSYRKQTKKSFKNSEFTSVVQKFDIERTDDNPKYFYKKIGNDYKFEETEVRVLKIIKDNTETNEFLNCGEEISLVFDKTNFYVESGGQVSDFGKIQFDEKLFLVNELENINGYIFHTGKLQGDNLNINEKGVTNINEQIRLLTMNNHTATHLLNAAIKKVLNSVSCQKSSFVNRENLIFDVGLYGKKISMAEIEKIEKLIQEVIKHSLKVETKLVNSQEFLAMDNVTLIPGEVYPEDGIRLISIDDSQNNFFSCEPCCGTHVLNTADLKDFCIVNCRSLSRSTISITAVTHDIAVFAHRNGQDMLKKVTKLQRKIEKNMDVSEDIISKIKHKLVHGNGRDDMMPVYVKHNCLNILSEMEKNIRGTEREHLKDLINLEMQTVLETNRLKSKNNNAFVVHFLGCSCILDNVSLQHATKVCPNLPILVVSHTENMVKARCCVPKTFVSENFKAERWLKQTVGMVFNGTCSPPKGQDGDIVCNMKPRKVAVIDWETQLAKALSAAKRYAENNL